MYNLTVCRFCVLFHKHQRWHPDIPPVATVEEGEVFRVECIDWTGGQIKNDDNSDDVKNVDLSQVYVRCISS